MHALKLCRQPTRIGAWMVLAFNQLRRHLAIRQAHTTAQELAQRLARRHLETIGACTEIALFRPLSLILQRRVHTRIQKHAPQHVPGQHKWFGDAPTMVAERLPDQTRL